jgi:hypothetical protein
VHVRWRSKQHSTPQHRQKIFFRMWKIKFASKSIDGATRYGSTNSLTWKTLSLIFDSLFPSWTTSTWPLGLVFNTDNQSTLERSFLKKGVNI